MERSGVLKPAAASGGQGAPSKAALPPAAAQAVAAAQQAAAGAAQLLSAGIPRVAPSTAQQLPGGAAAAAALAAAAQQQQQGMLMQAGRLPAAMLSRLALAASLPGASPAQSLQLATHLAAASHLAAHLTHQQAAALGAGAGGAGAGAGPPGLRQLAPGARDGFAGGGGRGAGGASKASLGAGAGGGGGGQATLVEDLELQALEQVELQRLEGVLGVRAGLVPVGGGAAGAGARPGGYGQAGHVLMHFPQAPPLQQDVAAKLHKLRLVAEGPLPVKVRGALGPLLSRRWMQANVRAGGS